MQEPSTPGDWNDVFDVHGVKWVTPNDKRKNAYVPTDKQKEALERGGLVPTDGRSSMEVSIRVLGDGSCEHVKASYYRSKGHPKRERRLGRQFVSSWLNNGDAVLIGARGGEVFAAKVHDPANRDAILEDLRLVTSGGGRLSETDRARPLSDDGEPMRAEFSVRGVGPDFTITVECGDGRRRTQYAEALELLLIRLADLGADLVSGRLVTSVAVRRAEEEMLDTELRPSPFSLPLRLQASQAADLRKALGRAGAAIGRPPNTSGNTTKRIALEVRVDPANAATAVELHKLLIKGAEQEHRAETTELDPKDIEILGTSTDQDEIEALRRKYARSTPAVKGRLSRYIERGNVGAKIKRKNLYRCQVCHGLGIESLGFEKRGGGHYVEAHHVMPVSELTPGSLGPQNVICVCPNHHRQLHYGRVEVAEAENHFLITLDGVEVSVQRN